MSGEAIESTVRGVYIVSNYQIIERDDGKADDCYDLSYEVSDIEIDYNHSPCMLYYTANMDDRIIRRSVEISDGAEAMDAEDLIVLYVMDDVKRALGTIQ